MLVFIFMMEVGGEMTFLTVVSSLSSFRISKLDSHSIDVTLMTKKT